MLIDKTWTLFLDRDGVINERLPDQYVRFWEEFQFCEGSLEAIVDLSGWFDKIVVVTNQQGIGKGLMTESMLQLIHQQLKLETSLVGGRIDQIYFCPDLASQNSENRKPNTGMAYQAKRDFPKIDFFRSIMVGDSISDMEFGIRLGMQTVFITSKPEAQEASKSLPINYRFPSLKAFAEEIMK